MYTFVSHLGSPHTFCKINQQLDKTGCKYLPLCQMLVKRAFLLCISVSLSCNLNIFCIFFYQFRIFPLPGLWSRWTVHQFGPSSRCSIIHRHTVWNYLPVPYYLWLIALTFFFSRWEKMLISQYKLWDFSSPGMYKFGFYMSSRKLFAWKKPEAIC